MNEPVGRDAQRAVIDAFVAAAQKGPAELTIQGEPGIGKTTLCRYAEAVGASAGLAVMACRPAEAESLLSFAALTDLLADVPKELFESLPAPQRHALAVAALREVPTAGATPDIRAAGTGLATLLAQPENAPTRLVLVDDEQWLDQATLDVLSFAFRRIEVPIGLLICRRSGSAQRASLSESLPHPIWREQLTLDGLTAAALFHIVRDQLDITLGRPTLVRIAETSAGNPFVAIELARALAASPDLSPTTLPVPRALQSLSVARLGKLSDGAKNALLAVASAPRPTTAMLDSLHLGQHIAEAEASGAVAVTNGRVAFSHPLLASATLELFNVSDHRAMHAHLSSLSDDPEAIARHRAFATPGSDDDVASALEDAARSATSRGATITALDLARLAVERTVDQNGLAAWERRVQLAELLHAAGDSLEAGRTLATIDDDCPPGSTRARGWLVLTEVDWQSGSAAQAEGHASAVLAEPDTDASLRLRALLLLADITNGETARGYAAEARRWIESTDVVDPTLAAWALCADIDTSMRVGLPLDRDGLARAILLERTDREWTSHDQVIAVSPVLLKWADHHEEALAAFNELAERADEEGNEGVKPYVTGHAFAVFLRMGRFDEAVNAAERHLAEAEATGQAGQRAQALYNFAWLHAYTGRFDAAMEAGKEVLAWAEQADDDWMEMGACWALGFSALTADDAPLACQWFDRWDVVRHRAGVLHPGISRGQGDHIEALVSTGAIDRATALAEEFEAAATRAELTSALAVAQRCRALVAAADGRIDESLVHVDEALRLHEECVAPFEQARALLAKGTILRRVKQKRSATDALDESASAFRRVGASAWAARAVDEARRVGRRPTASLELTHTERRIAELAADGLTNRQVAERAFISAKTVEANLAKVYRKLGISSRAELGARMAALTAKD